MVCRRKDLNQHAALRIYATQTSVIVKSQRTFVSSSTTHPLCVSVDDDGVRLGAAAEEGALLAQPEPRHARHPAVVVVGAVCSTEHRRQGDPLPRVLPPVELGEVLQQVVDDLHLLAVVLRRQQLPLLVLQHKGGVDKNASELELTIGLREVSLKFRVSVVSSSVEHYLDKVYSRYSKYNIVDIP